jgi:hypothetical protein
MKGLCPFMLYAGTSIKEVERIIRHGAASVKLSSAPFDATASHACYQNVESSETWAADHRLIGTSETSTRVSISCALRGLLSLVEVTSRRKALASDFKKFHYEYPRVRRPTLQWFL